MRVYVLYYTLTKRSVLRAKFLPNGTTLPVFRPKYDLILTSSSYTTYTNRNQFLLL